MSTAIATSCAPVRRWKHTLRQPSSGRGTPGPGSHAKRTPIDVEQRLLLFDVRGFLSGDADRRARHLDVEPGRFRFRIDIADVATERLTFLLQPLDPVDDA